MEFPQNRSGTVDWFTVFQDPESGFIVLLTHADTTEKLKECFMVIVDQLFSRKSDEEIQKTYRDLAVDVFSGSRSDSDLGARKIRLRMIMNRIMQDRIRKAEEYEEMQRAGSAPNDEKRMNL
jgi:hypothetical protein